MKKEKRAENKLFFSNGKAFQRTFEKSERIIIGGIIGNGGGPSADSTSLPNVQYPGGRP